MGLIGEVDVTENERRIWKIERAKTIALLVDKLERDLESIKEWTWEDCLNDDFLLIAERKIKTIEEARTELNFLL